MSCPTPHRRAAKGAAAGVQVVRRQQGTTLIIVLIMLVVIGLSAASSMRNAASGEKITNNLRLDALAQQYAEMGLQYCERQMAQPSAARTELALRDAALPAAVPVATALWSSTATWLNTPTAVIQISNVSGIVSGANSSVTPGRNPECLVEPVTLGAGSPTYLITARGFSPGYTADPTTGTTLSGAVVWLQSMGN